MDPILLHKKVTENAEELNNLVDDLITWEKEMKRKEQSRPEIKEELPPVRSKLRRSNMKDEAEKSNIPSASDDHVDQRQKREKSLLEKERGNEFVKQKKYAEAIHHYTQAIECYPRDATFYANRAFCFLNTKQWKEVDTDCTIALQIDPDYVKAYHRRALALKELNQLTEAQDDLQKALSIEPNNNCLKTDLAKIEKLINDKIISDSKSAQSKEANKTAAYLIKERGNAFVKKRNWQSAIESYTEACRLYPEDSSFYSNRALCYLKLDEPKKTILDCIRALELDPNNTKALYRKALANEMLSNDSSAHDDLLAAFKLDPDDKTIRDELNRIEKKLGLRKESDISTDKQSQPPSSNKRISGERFLKLGGKFVNPVKRPPHLISKKPMKKIQISNKSEIDVLQNALEELIPSKKETHVKETDDNKPAEDKSNVRSIPIQVETPQIDVNVLPCPKTSMQFITSWNKLLLRDPVLRYQYLKKVDGKNLPTIFKDALETDVFSQIIEILATEFVKSNEPVYNYLYGLSDVKRFSALILFASDEDKENIKLAIDHCDVLKEVSASELSSLKSRFYY